MRKEFLIGVVGLATCGAEPALAQYGAPIGYPGLYTSPEFTGGALGAGAANSAASQQQCYTSGGGRDGPKNVCSPQSAPRENHR